MVFLVRRRQKVILNGGMVVFRLAERERRSEKGLDGSGGISRDVTLRLR